MRRLICPRFCRYYKPDKEEDPGCGGLEYLKRRPELAGRIEELEPPSGEPLFGLSPDDPRLLEVCGMCAFLVDGCDFRDPLVSNEDCEPCGGLKVVAGLLASGLELGL